MNFVNLQMIIDFVTNTSSYGDVPPKFIDVITSNIGILSILILISLISLAGIYGIWTKIFGKEKAWMAFVPFYNLFKLFRAVDVNPYFSVAVFLPLVGLVPLMVFNFYLPRAFGLRGIVYGLAAVLAPWVFLPLLGFGKQYEYQYIKGKNVPFKDSFRIPVPGEEGYVSAYTPNEVGAIGSQISQAAALNMARNEELRREKAARDAEEAKAKAAKEREKAAPKKEKEEQTVEVSYDIFDNGTIEQSTHTTTTEPTEPLDTPPEVPHDLV